MAKEKKTWQWVTRDPKSTVCVIRFSAVKPRTEDGNYFWEKGTLTIGVARFEQLTGIRVEPGACLKVEFSARIIEPPSA